MISTLHGQTILYSNINTDIRIAKETGYQAIELHTDKLLRYLDAGYSADDLRVTLKTHGILPACIDILGAVERCAPAERRCLMDEARRLCEVAVTIGCPTIQLNSFCGLAQRPWDEILKLTAANIADIADLGQAYGIQFQVEGAAWTPIHSLSQCLQLIETVDRENVGLVIDFWHLWASRETTLEELARLNKDLIYGVHLADGKRPPEGESWVDEKLLRGFLPGDGDLPMAEWVAAVKATGFDGVVSGEILNDQLWERDLYEIAVDMRHRMEQYWKNSFIDP
jgi:sugar phosphate isomerase/epimerase